MEAAMRHKLVVLAATFCAGVAGGAALLAAALADPAVAAQANPAKAMTALEGRIASLEADLARLTAAINVGSSGNVTISGNKVKVNAPQFEVSSALAKFGGVIKGGVIDVDSVIAKSYTPGAGNTW
jgi:hypothetical protein